MYCTLNNSYIYIIRRGKEGKRLTYLPFYLRFEDLLLVDNLRSKENSSFLCGIIYLESILLTHLFTIFPVS